MLSQDIMTVAEDRIQETKVVAAPAEGRGVHDTGLSSQLLSGR